MSNPAYGYSNVPEKWAVRISDNGEFIHQNQNTVSDQGVVNVSHGCINLSADSAQAYFASAIYGDPVQVTGTSVQAPGPRPAARRPVRHTRTVAVTRRAQHGVLVGDVLGGKVNSAGSEVEALPGSRFPWLRRSLSTRLTCGSR